MIRIKPHSFSGPRAYFTAFDYRIVSRTEDLTTLEKNVERRLKILLLFKTNIVCAASHLTSDFAIRFFKKNEFLLEDGCLIPALREDKSTFEDLFNKKNDPLKKEKSNFLNSKIQKVVDWQLDENSMWFRNRFIEELESSNSLLRKSLMDISEIELNYIIKELKSTEILSRQLIEDVANKYSKKNKLILLNFRELLYHISGARVVKCESHLPQENYIDYDLVDYSQQRTRLSEETILWKLFIELAFESFQKEILPIEVIDILSFKDILEIRKPLTEKGFQNEYDSLVKMSMPSNEHNLSSWFFDINKLEEIRLKLLSSFKEVFENELPKFLKKKYKDNIKEFRSNGISFSLGLVGSIPGVGNLPSIISTIKDSPAFYMNLGELYNSLQAIKEIDNYQKEREKLLKKTILNTNISNKPLMLEMVELLTNTISERIRL